MKLNLQTDGDQTDSVRDETRALGMVVIPNPTCYYILRPLVAFLFCFTDGGNLWVLQ
jgi:hypothetical protein